MSRRSAPASRTKPAVRDCDRAFLRLANGSQLHYRHATAVTPRGAARARRSAADSIPVWLMHASPASSRSLEPLAIALAQEHARRVIAPDTPGNGDSTPLPKPKPRLADYADAFIEALDALGIERVDLYGFHTGAHIAIEMAIAHPGRVGAVALDGLLWLAESERREFLEHYAPPLQPDAHGTQFLQALQFIRDQAWFFPHFRRDAAHNLGAGAMPPALLHELTVELLKAAPTYHLAYHAVFRHRLAQRLGRLRGRAVLLMADAADPTRHGVRRAAKLVRGAQLRIGDEGWSAQGVARKATAIARFFDRAAR